jgi:hypothetical protein
MEMPEGARHHLSEPATLTLKVDQGTSLGEQTIEFQAKRTDGQIVTKKLEMNVIDLQPTSLSAKIASTGPAYSDPDDPDGQIAFCSLELVDEPTILGLVGARNDVTLYIDRRTKIEKVVANQRVTAVVADLRKGSTIQWDFRALLLRLAETNNPGASSGHIVLAKTIVIAADTK